MTRQEKLVIVGLLLALLLGTAVRNYRRHGHVSTDPGLKSAPASP